MTEEEVNESVENVKKQVMHKQQLTSEIGELEDEIRELRERKGELEGEKKRLQQRISSMDEATDEQRRYSALIDLADRCKDAFEDIKDELVDSRRDAVEEATSETFLRLTNRPDYYEGIRITRNYELRVLTETAERSIAEQRPSAGQRQIIAYSFIAGLSRFTTRNAPVVIDTPIGRLDPEHKNNLVNFYHEFSDQVMILYQPNELTEEDIEIMGDYISKHLEITIQNDDSSSTIQELPEIVAAPTED
jgi:DNA sulfur modification protein DndD